MPRGGIKAQRTRFLNLAVAHSGKREVAPECNQLGGDGLLLLDQSVDTNVSIFYSFCYNVFVGCGYSKILLRLAYAQKVS